MDACRSPWRQGQNQSALMVSALCFSKERDVAQKAILTFTDIENDQVKVNLEFDPPVKGDARMTAAISMAMQALQKVRDSNDEDEDE